MNTKEVVMIFMIMFAVAINTGSGLKCYECDDEKSCSKEDNYGKQVTCKGDKNSCTISKNTKTGEVLIRSCQPAEVGCKTSDGHKTCACKTELCNESVEKAEESVTSTTTTT